MDDELQCATLPFVDVGALEMKREHIAGANRCVIGKRLLAVKHTPRVDAEHPHESELIRGHHIEAERESGWRHQRSVAGCSRRALVGKDGVQIAYCSCERPDGTLLDLDDPRR